MKFGTVSGVLSTHAPFTSFAGASGERLFGTWYCLKSGPRAAATSAATGSFGSFVFTSRPTVKAMFDWPEQTHTSPTTTFVILIVFALETVISDGSARAGPAGSVAVHLPSSFARAFAVLPSKETVTSAPGSVQPQTGTGVPRWRTMPSEKMAATVTSAAGPLSSGSGLGSGFGGGASSTGLTGAAGAGAATVSGTFGVGTGAGACSAVEHESPNATSDMSTMPRRLLIIVCILSCRLCRR